MGLGAMYDGVRKPRMGREEETMTYGRYEESKSKQKQEMAQTCLN